MASIIVIVENLAVVSTKCKQFDRLSRSDRRLVGWVKYRLSKSSKPWIRLCLATFCKATGIGLRTAKRSLQKIRNDPKTEIVARTINENGRWHILVSSCSRLHGLTRSEPFTEFEDGKQRVVKESLRGKRVTAEQLVLNEDPVMWKAKSNDSLITNEINTQDSKFGTIEHLTTDQEVGGLEERTENPCGHPNQMTLPVYPGDAQMCVTSSSPIQAHSTSTETKFIRPNTECHFWDRHNKGGFSKEKQRRKHGNADFDQKLINLSFFIARYDLKREHWDNCKIKHRMEHGFTFALQELRRGCNRQTIVKAYSMALHEMHGVAVDAGVTEESSWQPSSTISRARRILIEGGCRGKWWSRITKKREQVVVTGSEA